MPFVDAYAQRKKHEVMSDTWGHLYPRPCWKYHGYLIVAIGDYGDEIIVKSEFTKLGSSPQRHEVEHSIFDYMFEKKYEPGIYKIDCTMYFYKTSDDMFLGKPVGKLMNIKIQEIKI